MTGVDLQYLSIDELENVIEDAKNILKERRKGEYKGLVNGVLKSIKTLCESGYYYYDAFESGCVAWTWTDIYNEIEAHYRANCYCYGEED